MDIPTNAEGEFEGVDADGHVVGTGRLVGGEVLWRTAGEDHDQVVDLATFEQVMATYRFTLRAA